MTQSPFTIEGPDDEGNVWILWTETFPALRTNLGPKDQVAETLSQWLAEQDYQEKTL